MATRIITAENIIEEVLRGARNGIVCIGCGCTESNPCTSMQEGPGGTMRLAHCSWAAVDEETGFGLCTRCALTPIDQLANKILATGG